MGTAPDWHARGRARQTMGADPGEPAVVLPAIELPGQTLEGHAVHHIQKLSG